MYRILMVCRAGVGSSLILEIKMNRVIEEYGPPTGIGRTNLDGVPGFDRDGIFILPDVAAGLKAEYPKRYIVGIQNIVDKTNLPEEMQMLLKAKEGRQRG